MATQKLHEQDRIGGARHRPRVALLGNFGQDEIIRYNQLFPTIWKGEYIRDINEQVSWVEIDLIIINPGVSAKPSWISYVNVICFSEDIDVLPGPIPGIEIHIDRQGVRTEGYALPNVDLPFSRRREADFVQLDNVRGWSILYVPAPNNPNNLLLDTIKTRKANNIIQKGALIYDPFTKNPFATIFIREKLNLGVAWLPQSIYNRSAWVELIVTQWAQSDRERFPGLGDWTRLPEWMVPEEEELNKRINDLENTKRKTIEGIDKEIGELQSDLTRTILETNKGVRQLLTAQGDRLVEEVRNIFDKIGFEVQMIDQGLDNNSPRREDLRLKDPSEQGQAWEAIVEVRGYKKSAGTTTDITRLSRFAELYQKERGYWPDKRLYVVNGQLEILQPQQRQKPLESASEDINIFSEQNGVIISTIDLFRVAKNLQGLNHEAIRESIKKAKGRWTINHIKDST